MKAYLKSTRLTYPGRRRCHGLQARRMMVSIDLALTPSTTGSRSPSLVVLLSLV